MIVDIFGFKVHTTIIEIFLLIVSIGIMLVPIYIRIKKELEKQEKEEH